MESRETKQRKTLTLGSLFDGSGGFPLAGILAGVEPVWASEIEPFAIRVTTKRLPKMRHYGRCVPASMAAQIWSRWISSPSARPARTSAHCRETQPGWTAHGHVACFYEAIRNRERNEGATTWRKYPRYIVWENVPGAVSAPTKGADFQSPSCEEVMLGSKEHETPPLPPT